MLGGITVKLGLSAPISTVHLVTALAILAGLLTIAGTRAHSPAPGATSRSWRGWPASGSSCLLAQLALGGYVRHTGAGLACPDFPLCSGDLFPARRPAARALGPPLAGRASLLGLFVHLAVASRRTALAGVGAAIGALAVLQVALGIAAVLLRLPVPVRAAHAAGGYALWGLLVWTALRAGVGGAALMALAGRRAAPAARPRRGSR